MYRENQVPEKPTGRRNTNFCGCGEDLRMFGCCSDFVVVCIPNTINVTSGEPYWWRLNCCENLGKAGEEFREFNLGFSVLRGKDSLQLTWDTSIMNVYSWTGHHGVLGFLYRQWKEMGTQRKRFTSLLSDIDFWTRWWVASVPLSVFPLGCTCAERYCNG